MDYDLIIAEIEKQEKKLVFKSFSNENAWELGNLLVKRARNQNSEVTVDITRNQQQLFHFSMEGTSPNNDAWVRRKMNVVNKYSHSSYYIGMLYEKKGSSIHEDDALPPEEYAAHGGSFPINIVNTGVIGTITVSGLPSADDHNMIVTVLEEFLNVKI